MSISRRGFLGSAIAASVATGLNPQNPNAQEKAKEGAPPPANPFGSGKRPIIVCANNGRNYLEDAFVFLKGGGDTLDAAIRVVKGPEDDPNDDSVGLGGLPNEEGGSNSMPAACMDPRVARDPWVESATSRTLHWFPKPSWITPGTSCWSAKVRNDSP